MIITADKITIKPVSLTDPQVQHLIAILDRYQRFLYGQQYCSLESALSLQKNKAFVLGAYADTKLVGIGAVKINFTYGEIKRLVVEKKFRRSGVAADIIDGLESYVRIQNKTLINLETGRLQFAAIHFYEKHGYGQTGSFGQYRANPVSIYFQKYL